MVDVVYQNWQKFNFIKGVSAGGVILLADADAHTSGAKAAACGRLASLAAVSRKGNMGWLLRWFTF